jgi:hypothetical protein
LSLELDLIGADEWDMDEAELLNGLRAQMMQGKEPLLPSPNSNKGVTQALDSESSGVNSNF